MLSWSYKAYYAPTVKNCKVQIAAGLVGQVHLTPCRVTSKAMHTFIHQASTVTRPFTNATQLST
jgi:hypothetical protein